MNKQIKERGILFSSEMVRAILDDRKTETRRVVKPQPEKDYIWRFHNDGLYQHIYGHYKMPSSSFGEKYFKCPYGGHGDILYVRETFYIERDISRDFVWYRADCDENNCKAHRWKPSIHMPKKFSRIKLKIKEIRVEKLRDITVLDAINEGSLAVDTELVRPGYLEQARLSELNGEKPPLGPGTLERFKYLWDSLNKKRGFGWDKDPFVWFLKFERIK